MTAMFAVIVRIVTTASTVTSALNADGAIVVAIVTVAIIVLSVAIVMGAISVKNAHIVHYVKTPTGAVIPPNAEGV